MKKYIIILLTSFTFSLFGQTNTFPTTGNVGIGTTSPQGNLHISSSTSGDAVLRIESDTDNNNESDNPRIEMYQDNTLTGAYIGFNKDWSGPDNIFRIATRYNGTVSSDRFIINTANGNIGVGTSNPLSRLNIEGGDILLGNEVNSNGLRRKIQIFGYDNNAQFWGTMHSNWEDNKRTFDIYTNNQTQQIKIDASANSTARIAILPGINSGVGIGTTSPDAKLTVKGDIHTQEVKVDLAGAVAPDFVFEEDYDLRTLEETASYIKTNKHLPDIPSAAQMEEEGFKLKEMNLKLLQKVEELTLYLIEQNEEIVALKNKVKQLEKRK